MSFGKCLRPRLACDNPWCTTLLKITRVTRKVLATNIGLRPPSVGNINSLRLPMVYNIINNHVCHMESAITHGLQHYWKSRTSHSKCFQPPLTSRTKIWVPNQLPGYPRSGRKSMHVKEEEERKSVLTMASYTCWRMQTALTNIFLPVYWEV